MDDETFDELVDLRHRVFHNEKMDEERKISDEKYAAKLVEKIVFGMITMILVAVVGSIIALVVR
jgi:hypothetical protein